MIVSTWNLLHHVHAINWGDLPATAPDEPIRIAAIAERVQELLKFSHAMCLQEVSGDQLRALACPHTCSFALPRVPRPRHGASVLADPTEHLVVVSMLPGTIIEQRAFASDPGKGFVAVQLANGLVVVSTHVSHGERAVAQLDELAAWVRGRVARPVVIGGDFNAERDTVMAALGHGFTIAALTEPSRPSRPRSSNGGKSQQIDHVIGHFTNPSEAGVEDGRGLSDHNPVWSKLE